MGDFFILIYSYYWGKIYYNMKNRAFTLIELLIVVMVIGILATLAIPTYDAFVRRAKCAEAAQMFGAIKTAQEIYYLEHNVYSTDIYDESKPEGMRWVLSGLEMPLKKDRYFEYGIKIPTSKPAGGAWAWQDVAEGASEYCIAAWRDIKDYHFPEHPHVHADEENGMSEVGIYLQPADYWGTETYPPVEHSHGSIEHTHGLWADPEDMP